MEYDTDELDRNTISSLTWYYISEFCKKHKIKNVEELEDLFLDRFKEELPYHHDNAFDRGKEAGYEEGLEEGYKNGQMEVGNAEYISMEDHLDEISREKQISEEQFLIGYEKGYKDGADWERPQHSKDKLKEYDYD
jgi:flagellar biosynthesis/type III secretory pathway protein FliH